MKADIFGPLEAWFIVGSQHLYGPGPLAQVAANGSTIAEALAAAPQLPVRVVFKPIVTTPEEIHNICQAANAAPNCIGLICWMHTFSPAKMWIAGLQALQKPFVQLHTQFNAEIPWSTIDMDFMNLNQTAHGGREFGYIGTRLRAARKVVVGHWQDDEVLARLGVWMRAAAAWHDAQGAKFARFGDNMREVAVTEGNKVSAQMQFGYSVNGYGIGDLVARVNAVTEKAVSDLIAVYEESYTVVPALQADGARRQSLRDAARIELGIRAFLEEGGFKGYTDTFEDLHGLKQLPGVASQRLMADGYGFGAEGDWKTAALLRAMKVMSAGLAGGTSFMEDYTYHFGPDGAKVLGAHMLEICPSIAAARPSLEIHPLGIGGKEDPVRLVFDSQTGPALNASVIDLGTRYRLIVNTVEVVETEAPLPKLPVARALWRVQPNFQEGVAAWILAGGAHHTGFSLSLTAEHMEDFANIAGIEYLLIDENSSLREIKKELKWNELYYHMAAAF
ncbi:MAG: L-arabinose isomerase [Anaerolineales bacterium]|nr:L-arabinose isomerase [Anaerolineales bacterium]MCB0010903.1 L-arabinose isomerase [Anaerolineales bacterium]MCB8961402.1 L-arabinose isomerase [Ardenticatenales bacterium]